MQSKVKGRGGQKKVVELGGGELQRIRRGERPLSKREALSFVMGAFDPLGYIRPGEAPALKALWRGKSSRG